MRVYISKTVYAELTAFYAESLRRHITLDEYTVHRKIDRIISAIHELSDFPTRYPLAQFKQEWIDQGYRDMKFEGFHIGYTIMKTPSGEEAVFAEDICYDLLFHN